MKCIYCDSKATRDSNMCQECREIRTRIIHKPSLKGMGMYIQRAGFAPAHAYRGKNEAT